MVKVSKELIESEYSIDFADILHQLIRRLYHMICMHAKIYEGVDSMHDEDGKVSAKTLILITQMFTQIQLNKNMEYMNTTYEIPDGSGIFISITDINKSMFDLLNHFRLVYTRGLLEDSFSDQNTELYNDFQNILVEVKLFELTLGLYIDSEGYTPIPYNAKSIKTIQSMKDIVFDFDIIKISLISLMNTMASMYYDIITDGIMNNSHTISLDITEEDKDKHSIISIFGKNKNKN